MELPPRARRILLTSGFNLHRSGTTSACAENTPVAGSTPGLRGNYLRVRGEYLAPVKWAFQAVELPPRARRIHILRLFHAETPGTTSACAENTKTPHPSGHEPRNYLRVRGEYDG